MDAIDEFLQSAISSREDLEFIANQQLGTLAVFDFSSLFWCAVVCHAFFQTGHDPTFLQTDVRVICALHSTALFLYKWIASPGDPEYGGIGLVKWTSLEGDTFSGFCSFIAVVLLADWFSGGMWAARVQFWLNWNQQVFLRANSFILRKARDSMVWLGVAIRRKFERLRGQKEVIIRNKVWRMVLRLGVAVRQTIDRLLGPEEVWEDGIDEHEQDE